MNAATVTETLPGEGGPPPRKRNRAATLAVIATIAMVAALIGAASVKVPYYAIGPGGAVPVNQLVKVEGGPSYPPKGTIYLCTVSLKQTTILEAIEGWLDPDVDVVKERVVLPPSVSRKDLRTFNLQLMDTSKEQALGVAFEQLGYDAIKGQGAVVDQVAKGSPADGVLTTGDVIVAVDGSKVELHADAVRLLGAHRPGDEARLKVHPRAGGPERDVTVRLAAKPDHPTRPLLGVTLRTNDPTFDFPFKVDVASERIGGPSAGLAFTLEVLDVLTKGELTGGHRVAATGTIELDGSVGPVGGVAQKTVSVKDAGAELFLVPRDELASARAHAGRKLRVEPVDDLQDALRILATLGGNGLTLRPPPNT